jgi:hypothetical protein
MFRTEVVKSKNLRKSNIFKAFNGVALFIIFFVIILSLNILGNDSVIVQWVQEHYRTVISPTLMVLALIIIVFSMVTSSLVRTPSRLGSIELDENEIRYLEHDELVETIPHDQITQIVFEFYSRRMRSNPAGCMNYLLLKTKNGSKTYEIVVGNELHKAQLGETFEMINKKLPVTIRYAYFLKRIFKDKDFKGLKTA